MKAEGWAVPLLVLALLGSACTSPPRVPPAAMPDALEPGLAPWLDLMLRAEQARGETRGDLLRLLERAAVMRPSPHSRARLALVLAQGEAARAELERAAGLLADLFDDPEAVIAVHAELATLLMQQRAAVERRLREGDAQEVVETRLADLRERYTRELRLHASTRRERDGALDRLHDARQRLRAIADIELGAPSGGG